MNFMLPLFIEAVPAIQLLVFKMIFLRVLL